VRRFLPQLIDLVWKRKINPGKVFDLILPLDQVAGLPSDGRAPRDQDAAASITHSLPPETMGHETRSISPLIRHK
jgi:hypothetical protein